MHSVKIQNGKITVGREKIALIGGEFHFWRIDPVYWDRILKSIRELGINLIATYVCWEFHQIAKGKFDFTGKTSPRRNLKAFLDLTKKRGFKLFIRPGPYIYSEWKNLGIPDEAARHHRMSPQFLKLSLNYMKSVCKILKPYLATRGGHIVLFQADNEIDPMTAGFEKELGLTGGNKPFQRFLKEKYASVQVLNEVWGTFYRSFQEAKAVTAGGSMDPKLWARYYDTRDFVETYSSEKATWMTEQYRKLGIDVPVVLNTYSEFEVHNWRDFEKRADLAGVDLYPENELSGEESHRLFLERNRVLRSYSKAPYIAEFESGLWHGFIYRVGSLTPNHYTLCALSVLSAGVVGWNWYMLVNRDNWYQAPINEMGEFRLGLKKTFSDIVRLYQKMSPADCEKVVNASVTFSWAHHRSGFAHKENSLLKAFYAADLDYDFCDLQTGSRSNPVFFYNGEEWLPEEELRFLLNAVEKGVRLVLFQKGPRYNEYKEPFNLLNLPLPEAILGGREVMTDKKGVCFELGRSIRAKAFSAVHCYSEEKGAKTIWAGQLPSSAWELQWKQADGSRYRAGLILKRGKGEIMLLGAEPNAELLHAVYQYYGIQKGSYSTTEGVSTALFKRKGRKEYYLVCTNNSGQQVDARVHLSFTKRKMKALSLTTGADCSASYQKEFPELFVSLSRKSGDIVKITQ